MPTCMYAPTTDLSCSRNAKTYDKVVEATTLFPVLLEHFPLLEEHIDYLADNPTLIVHLAKFVRTLCLPLTGC